ncbi:uncharacterized protein N7484_005339 [Penicillium longicatenatum]|uniref:uncharacterized protein n=1 Tax=Penicillium longicatenatum TaxID=1561947 RepID=UPI0025488FD0|nr:uncharacterized protein N7484_005339 [Penicillium longicatenatum]KAJ5651616.1 hypothetical protein N7484_005339 [Penicillium longicatenatum]
MSTSFWGLLEACEMGAASRGESKSCCGITRSGAPSKNLIKTQDIKQGRQKLARLGSFPFEISTYNLCFAILRNTFSAHDSIGTDKPTDLASSGTKQPSEIKRRQTMTLKVLLNHNIRAHLNAKPSSDENSDSSPSTITRLPRSMGSYVTAATLRANSVPWCVSPAQPAILSCITNIRAGLQGIHLHSISRSEEVSDVYCMFCLGDDEDHANESAVLRCTECRALSHLACTEEWLAKRDAGFEISCCVCRNEGAVDALIRPHRASADTERAVNDATAGISCSASAADTTRDIEILPGPSLQSVERRRPARLARQSYQPRGSRVSGSLRRSRRLQQIHRN